MSYLSVNMSLAHNISYSRHLAFRQRSHSAEQTHSSVSQSFVFDYSTHCIQYRRHTPRDARTKKKKKKKTAGYKAMARSHVYTVRSRRTPRIHRSFRTNPSVAVRYSDRTACERAGRVKRRAARTFVRSERSRQRTVQTSLSFPRRR